MRRRLGILGIAVLLTSIVLGGTFFASRQRQASVTDGTHRIFASRPAWSQDFSANPALDHSIWTPSTGVINSDNNEQQYYTDQPENLRVEHGALRLIATNATRSDGYRYQSARIDTSGKKTILYGRLDVVAQLPQGIGTWPALWLLPASEEYANRSPMSDESRYLNGGEIDIMESIGSEPNTIYGTVHTTMDTALHTSPGQYGTMVVGDSASAFHTYTLLWTPTKLSYAIDGHVFYSYSRMAGATYKTWPFDRPFYLIINLALGGSWGGMNSAYPNGIDSSALPASLDIRSVSYYPYVGRDH